MSHKCLMIKVIGRVQGVGFRYSTKRTAEALNIKGWVKNNPDGSVEIRADGDDSKLENFYSWCQKGPAGAIVQDTYKEEINSDDNFSQFRIMH